MKGRFWTFRQIVQGLIDNFLGRDSEWRWRLNDEVPIPKDAHPLTNPGLELAGPWHPLDMAFNALNSLAPMNMPDFEDASPPHFQPDGTPANQPVGIFARVEAGTLNKIALAAHDYVYDVFPGIEGEQRPHASVFGPP